MGAGLGPRSEPWDLCCPGGEVMGAPILAIHAVLMREVVGAGLQPHLISRVLSCPEVLFLVLFPMPQLVLLGVLDLRLMLILRPHFTLVRKGLGANFPPKASYCPGVAAGAVVFLLTDHILPLRGRGGCWSCIVTPC